MSCAQMVYAFHVPPFIGGWLLT